MKPYSNEFRGEVLAACDRGRSTREVATHFNVSESWVRRVKQERRELKKLLRASRGGGRRCGLRWRIGCER